MKIETKANIILQVPSMANAGEETTAAILLEVEQALNKVGVIHTVGMVRVGIRVHIHGPVARTFDRVDPVKEESQEQASGGDGLPKVDPVQ